MLVKNHKISVSVWSSSTDDVLKSTHTSWSRRTAGDIECVLKTRTSENQTRSGLILLQYSK